jgi:hypothetical protein
MVNKYMKNAQLQKELPYNPVITLLGIYLKECIPRIEQSNLHTHVHCSISHNSQALGIAQMPHN